MYPKTMFGRMIIYGVVFNDIMMCDFRLEKLFCEFLLMFGVCMDYL